MTDVHASPPTSPTSGRRRSLDTVQHHESAPSAREDALLSEAKRRASLDPLRIPQPKEHLLFKNQRELEGPSPALSMMALAAELGPIYRLSLSSMGEVVVVSSYDIARQVCEDTERFSSCTAGAAAHLRDLCGDDWMGAGGASTLSTLAPMLSSASVRELLFDSMLHGADRLVQRWEQAGRRSAEVDIGDDLARLTLDTLGLCAFSTPLGCLDRERTAPDTLVAPLEAVLHEAVRRSSRAPLMTKLMWSKRHRFEQNVRALNDAVDALVAARLRDLAAQVQREDRPVPVGAPAIDLLALLLQQQPAPDGGAFVDVAAVRRQLLAFLIAGYEFAAGVPAFALYLLQRHPEALARARAELADVLDERRPRPEHLSQLRYLQQVVLETLRLWPAVPVLAYTARQPARLGDGYAVRAGATVLVLVPQLHRDRSVWDERGRRSDVEDASAFDPHRFASGSETPPPHAYQPFGAGPLAAVLSAFIRQHTMLVLARVLQRLELRPAGAGDGAALCVQQTLGWRPERLLMRTQRRSRAVTGATSAAAPAAAAATGAAGEGDSARSSSDGSSSSRGPASGIGIRGLKPGAGTGGSSSGPDPRSTMLQRMSARGGSSSSLRSTASSVSSASGATRFVSISALAAAAVEAAMAAAGASPNTAPASARLLVLHSTSNGEDRSLAQRLLTDASMHGCGVAAVDTLDAYAGRLPCGAAAAGITLLVLVVAGEGEAPERAREFLPWLESLPLGALRGLRYAVLGSDHPLCADVPRRIDAALAIAGAVQLLPLTQVETAGDFYGGLERWQVQLWRAVAPTASPALPLGGVARLEDSVAGRSPPAAPDSSRLRVRAAGPAAAVPAAATPVAMTAVVVENRELTAARRAEPPADAVPSVRHVVLQLPPDTEYRAGDVLWVQPRNPSAVVERVLARFGLDAHCLVFVREDAKTDAMLPTGAHINVVELLTQYVELQQPATYRHIDKMMRRTPPGTPEHAWLQALQLDAGRYEREVQQHRLSLLDLLERTPGCAMAFATFLAVLPPLRPRPYAIASTPVAAQSGMCALCVAVLDAPALSGTGRFQGVCSSYLAAAVPGTRLEVTLQRGVVLLRGPPTTLATPLILIAMGAGMGAMRALLQERALQMWDTAVGTQAVRRPLLFVGHRQRDIDYLYGGELERWAQAGVVDVRPAFLRDSHPQAPRSVLQRMWQDRHEIVSLFKQGARVVVCGDRRLRAPLREVVERMYCAETGASVERAARWLDALEHDGQRVCTVWFD